MRKFLMAGCAFFAMIGAANASLDCGIANVNMNDGSSARSRVVSTHVEVNDHVWTVLHTLADGRVVDRSIQYIMEDHSNNDQLEWSGTLVSNPKLVMIGKIMTLRSTGQPTYNEWLYKGGVMIFHSMSICKSDVPVQEPMNSPAPVVVAPIINNAPAAAPSPIINNNNNAPAAAPAPVIVINPTPVAPVAPPTPTPTSTPDALKPICLKNYPKTEDYLLCMKGIVPDTAPSY